MRDERRPASTTRAVGVGGQRALGAPRDDGRPPVSEDTGGRRDDQEMARRRVTAAPATVVTSTQPTRIATGRAVPTASLPMSS